MDVYNYISGIDRVRILWWKWVGVSQIDVIQINLFEPKYFIYEPKCIFYLGHLWYIVQFFYNYYSVYRHSTFNFNSRMIILDFGLWQLYMNFKIKTTS